MNLSYTLELLLASETKPAGFMKVKGDADRQVRLMVHAGLVEAVLDNDGEPGSFTAITRITEIGEAFLRTFRERAPSLCRYAG